MEGYTQINETTWQNDETGVVYVGRDGQSLESILQEAAEAAEAAEGQPYPPPPGLPTLKPWQFRAMLDIGGIAQTVENAIAAMADPTQRAVAKARLDYSIEYSRNDPLVIQLAPVVGLSDAQIDALWSQAAQLQA